MSNQITKGTLTDAISVELLEAVAASIVAKGKAAANAGIAPSDWDHFSKQANACEAFKELIHTHAHAIMEVEERGGCTAIMAAVAMAVIWGLEIAQAMSESTELDKLMVN